MSASLDRLEISLMSSSPSSESSRHTTFFLLFNLDRVLLPLAILSSDDRSSRELFLRIDPHIDRREPLVMHISFYAFSYYPPYFLQPRHGTKQHSQYLSNFLIPSFLLGLLIP